jgi:Ca-activated chloride channel homolog
MKEKDKEKMKKIRWFLVLLVGAGIISACERDPFVAADPLYRVGKYDEAWQVYKKAAGEFKESPLLYYNLGVGLYKKGDYQQAVEHFTKALITENVDLEARANFNIGNCRFRQGEEAEKDDLVKAVELYREAQD